MTIFNLRESLFRASVVTICSTTLLILVAIAAASGASPDLSSSKESLNDSFQISAVGHLGGAAATVTINGEYAYVGFAHEMAIIDITGQPVRVAYVLLESKVEQILYADGYAYVATGSAGLSIVDVSKPKKPKVVGRANTPGYARGLNKEGTMVYVADGSGGLRIISVIDPSEPVEIGFTYLPASALGVDSSGRYAYVASTQGGLQVVDVVNPSDPTLVGDYDTGGSSSDVVVRDSLAYVADGEAGLNIIDLTNPLEPAGLAQLSVPGFVQSLTLTGDHALLAAGEGGLRIIDISDPLDLAEVGFIDTLGRSVSIAQSGSMAYLADWSMGLQIIDISTISSPTPFSSFEPPSFAWGGIVSQGHFTFVGDETGVKIVDSSSPKLPVLAGHEYLGASSEHMAIDGYLLYVASGYNGLNIVNVSDVFDPELIGQLDTPGYSSGIALEEGVAYVADYNQGLRVIQVISATNPVELAHISLDGIAVAADAKSGMVYVACSGGGLRVVDAGALEDPIEVGHYATANSVIDVKIDGDIAYLAEGGGGLGIVDISTPSLPVEIGRLTSVDYAISLTIDDGYAYVSDFRGGLHVVDISEPEAPKEIAFYFSQGVASGVSINAGDAILAKESWGVLVVTGDLDIWGEVVDHNDQPISGVKVDGSHGRRDWSSPNGSFSIGGYLPGTYAITPTMPEKAFRPSMATVSVPQGEPYPRFTILPAPITTTLEAGSPSDVIYFDVQDLPTLLQVPAGAVTSTTVLKITPTLSSGTYSSVFAGHAFEVAMSRNGSRFDEFSRPVTTTITYSDLDIHRVSDESRLWLRWWNDGEWRDAAESCVPTSQYERNTMNNSLSIAVCKGGAIRSERPY